MAPTTMPSAPALPLTGEAAPGRVRDLLPSFRSAMPVTHAMDGAERQARPAGLVGDAAAFDGTLFPDDRSRKIVEIAPQPRASRILDSHPTLIRFDVERAESRSSPGGMLQVLGAFTEAIATGRPGQGGEQGTLELSPGAPTYIR